MEEEFNANSKNIQEKELKIRGEFQKRWSGAILHVEKYLNLHHHATFFFFDLCPCFVRGACAEEEEALCEDLPACFGPDGSLWHSGHGPVQAPPYSLHLYRVSGCSLITYRPSSSDVQRALFLHGLGSNLHLDYGRHIQKTFLSKATYLYWCRYSKDVHVTQEGCGGCAG